MTNKKEYKFEQINNEELFKLGIIPNHVQMQKYISKGNTSRPIVNIFNDFITFEEMLPTAMIELLLYCNLQLVPMTILRGNKMVDGKVLKRIIMHFFNRQLYRQSDGKEVYSQSTIKQLTPKELYDLNQIMARLIISGKITNWGVITNDKYGFVDLDIGDHQSVKGETAPLIDLALISRNYLDSIWMEGHTGNERRMPIVNENHMMYFFPSKHGVRVLFSNRNKRLHQGTNQPLLHYHDLGDKPVTLWGDTRVGNSLVMMSYIDANGKQRYDTPFACYKRRRRYGESLGDKDFHYKLEDEYPWYHQFAIAAYEFSQPKEHLLDIHDEGLHHFPSLKPITYKKNFEDNEIYQVDYTFYHVNDAKILKDYEEGHLNFVEGCQPNSKTKSASDKDIVTTRNNIQRAIKLTQPKVAQKHHSAKYKPNEETKLLVEKGILKQALAFTKFSEIAWKTNRKEPFEFIHAVTGKKRYNIFVQVVRLFATRTNLSATGIEKLINRQAKAIDLDISDIDLHSIIKVYEQAKIDNNVELVPSNVELAAFKALWGRALAVDLTTINKITKHDEQAAKRFDTLKGGFTLAELRKANSTSAGKKDAKLQRCRWLLDEINWFNNLTSEDELRLDEGTKPYHYPTPEHLKVDENTMFRLVPYTKKELADKRISDKEWEEAKKKTGIHLNIMNPLMSKHGLRQIKAQIACHLWNKRMQDPADALTAPAKNGRGIDQWWHKNLTRIPVDELLKAEKLFKNAVAIRNKILADDDDNRTLPKRIDAVLGGDKFLGFGFKMSFKLDLNNIDKFNALLRYVQEDWDSCMTLQQFEDKHILPLAEIGAYKLIRRSPLRTNQYSNGRVVLTLPADKDGRTLYAYMYGKSPVRKPYPKRLPKENDPKYRSNEQGEKLYHIDRENYYLGKFIYKAIVNWTTKKDPDGSGKERIALNAKEMTARYNLKNIDRLSYAELWGVLFEFGLLAKAANVSDDFIFNFVKSMFYTRKRKQNSLTSDEIECWDKHSRFMQILDLFTDGNKIPVVPVSHIRQINKLFNKSPFNRALLERVLSRYLTKEEMESFKERNFTYTQNLEPKHGERLEVKSLREFNVANKDNAKVLEFLEKQEHTGLTPTKAQGLFIAHYLDKITHLTDEELDLMTADDKRIYKATDAKQPEYLKKVFTTAVNYIDAKPKQTKSVVPKVMTAINGSTKSKAKQFVETKCDSVPTGMRNQYLLLLCSVALRAGYDKETAYQLIKPAFLANINNTDGEYTGRQVKSTLESLINSKEQNNYKYAGVALNRANFGQLMKECYSKTAYDDSFNWLFTGAGNQPAKPMEQLKRLPLSERIRIGFKALQRVIKDVDDQTILTNEFIGNYNHLVYNEAQTLNNYKRASLLKAIETLTGELNAYDVYTIMQQQLPQIQKVLNSSNEHLSRDFGSRQELIQAMFFCQKFMNGFKRTNNPHRHSSAFMSLLNRVNSTNHKQKHNKAIKGSFFDYLPLNAFLLSLQYEIKRIDNQHLNIKRKGLKWYLTFLQKAQMADAIITRQTAKKEYSEGLHQLVGNQLETDENGAGDPILTSQTTRSTNSTSLGLSTINTG